jgi:hypothetical protein
MSLEEFGFQPILVETSLPLDQEASLWTTSPDSYRPGPFLEQTPNRKAIALRREGLAGDEEREPTLQRHLRWTRNSSAMADSVPLNHDAVTELRYALHTAKKASKGKYIPNEVLERLTGSDIIERAVKDISYEYSTLKQTEDFAAKLCKDYRILVVISVQGSSFPWKTVWDRFRGVSATRGYRQGSALACRMP